jgi:hypothetical protein
MTAGTSARFSIAAMRNLPTSSGGISGLPGTRESVVLSGWGERAGRYRNIRAASAVEIAVAGERFAPTQRFFDSAEPYEHSRSYVQRNRLLAPFVRRVLGITLDSS